MATKLNIVALAVYIAPSQFLKIFKAQNPEFAIVPGTILDWNKMGLPAHQTFGPLPTLEVVTVNPSGSVEGWIKCEECEEKVFVHAGDLFQKRRCEVHQKKVQNLYRKGMKTAEEHEAAKAEKAAAKLQKVVEAAQAKANAAQVKAQAAMEAAQANAKAAAERLAALTGKPVVTPKAPKAPRVRKAKVEATPVVEAAAPVVTEVTA
jgi:hypothetical protein